MAKPREGRREVNIDHKSLKTLRNTLSQPETHFFSPNTDFRSCFFKFLFFYYYNESQKERKHRNVGAQFGVIYSLFSQQFNDRMSNMLGALVAVAVGVRILI
jgi:hypothetical protein